MKFEIYDKETKELLGGFHIDKDIPLNDMVLGVKVIWSYMIGYNMTLKSTGKTLLTQKQTKKEFNKMISNIEEIVKYPKEVLDQTVKAFDNEFYIKGVCSVYIPNTIEEMFSI